MYVCVCTCPSDNLARSHVTIYDYQGSTKLENLQLYKTHQSFDFSWQHTRRLGEYLLSSLSRFKQKLHNFYENKHIWKSVILDSSPLL